MSKHPSDYRILISELRRILKERRMTYKDLAARLQLTEAGVKRIFLKSDGKVSTLARISEALGFSFVELVSSSKLNVVKTQFLTEQQEKFLAANFDYYVFFNELVVRKKSVSEIQRGHGLSVASVRKYLRTLDKMNLIEVGPHDRIKMKIKEPIGFLESGKLRMAVHRNFCRSVTNTLTEIGDLNGDRRLHTREWTMSPATLSNFSREIENIIKQYDQVAARDHALLDRSDLMTLNLLIGMLPEALPYSRIQNLVQPRVI